MIRMLVRAPHGAEFAADAVRITASLSIFVAVFLFPAIDVLTVAAGAFATLVPRALGVRAALDIALGIVIPVAAWSAVLELYESTGWWDLPVHFAMNGLLAALVYVLLTRFRLIPDADDLERPTASGVVLVGMIGLSLGVLWELAEWFIREYVDPDTFVGYTDTLGDLVAGGLGSIVAGFLVHYLAGNRRDRPDAQKGGP